MSKKIYKLNEEILKELNNNVLEKRKKYLDNDALKKRISENEKRMEFLTALYGSQFGVPGKLWNGKLQAQDVELAIKFLDKEAKNPFVFKMEHGLFQRKPKKEDYEEAVAHLQILKEYYSRLYNDQMACIQNGNTTDTVAAYCEEAKKLKSNILCDDKDWFEFKRPNGKNTHIYLGDIFLPLEKIDNGNENIKRILQELRNENLLDEQEQWIKMPLSYSGKEAFALFVDYSYEEEVLQSRKMRTTPVELLHNLMYQFIRSMPLYTYSFYYFDPVGAGRTLGEFQEIGRVVDGNAYWLNEKIFDNTFRLLNKADNRDKMCTILKELSDQVAQTNTYRSFNDVNEYNLAWLDDNGLLKENAELIPQKIVIFENTHNLFDRASYATIKTLLENCRQCGITLIFVSQHSSREKLDEFECDLCGSRYVDVLEWNVEVGGENQSLRARGTTLGEENDDYNQYNFQILQEAKIHARYIDTVRDAYAPKFDVETNFEKLIDIDAEWGKGIADTVIEIPVGVNSRGQTVTIQIGGSEGAHALMAGATGCGKSSFLHTIINGVLLKYRPTDVQLWLSDYKSNEFRRYMENTPSNIAYVAVERSKEYSLHFIDKIYAELENRAEAFKRCTSVQEYRNLHGADSMPRILIIIDEFHAMSNHIKDEPEYKDKLGNILREGRAFGITLLLADQTCGVGLQGLKEDAKDQLTCRMAMMTKKEEYNAVFNISNSKDIIPTVAPYEIVIERIRKVVDDKGRQVNKKYYEHCKTIYTNTDIREQIARESIMHYGEAIEPMIIDRSTPPVFEWQKIRKEEGKAGELWGIPLYLGAPTDFKKYLAVELCCNYGENLISIGRNMKLQEDMIRNIIESICKRSDEYRVIVATAEYDRLYGKCKGMLDGMRKRYSNIQLAVDEEEICRLACEMEAEMIRRDRVRDPKEKIFVIWLGLDDISRNLSRYGTERPDVLKNTDLLVHKNAFQENQTSLEKMFDNLFGDEVELRNRSGETDSDELLIFDANEVIEKLFADGSKSSIHQIVFFTAVAAINRTLCIKKEFEGRFKHKIALHMGTEEARDFLSKGNLILTPSGEIIPENMAVYYDGEKARRFIPFVEKESVL